MSNLLDNIFINLRVIGKIPPKGRISTTSPGQVKLEEEGYTSKIWRTLTGDSRDKSVKLLSGLANDVTEISDNIISSLYFSRQYEGDKMGMFQINENTKKCHQLRKLVRELDACKAGLHNLLNTYSRDVLITSRIEEVEDKFDIQIEKITKALQHIKEDPATKTHTNVRPGYTPYNLHSPHSTSYSKPSTVPADESETINSEQSEEEEVNLFD
jgi:hypothetical protein